MAQNFALNAIEAQIIDEMSNEDGTPSETGVRLDYVDTAFTIIFTLELLVNAYAHWFRFSGIRISFIFFRLRNLIPLDLG
jgi:hypothetical protein